MKHGLLARVIMPPKDVRGSDRLYRQIRQELIDEFRPQTFTQHATIDAVARDYLQLARAGAMAEALQWRPERTNDDVSKRWRRVIERQRELKAIERAIAAISHGENDSCTARGASTAAQQILTAVEQTESDVKPTEDDLPESELTDFDRQELASLKAVWAKIKPPRKKMLDAGRIAEVLRREVAPSTAEAAWLRRVLQYLADASRTWLKTQKDVEHEIERREHAKLAVLAQTPQQLLLLQRYERGIHRLIKSRLQGLSHPR